MKEKIYNLLDEKIQDVFLEMQEELNIKYGDVTPLEAYALEEIEQKMTDLIESILLHEMED